MSLFKMPTAGTPYLLTDFIAAKIGLFRTNKVFDKFIDKLKAYLQVENLALVNSGTTANFVIYQVLKDIRKREEQTEIILSAYTAPSLLLPIEAAGLKPVLVDTDSATFNMDISKIENAISENTLAIMPIHMFGIPMVIEPLLKMAKEKDIFVIEDGASALGSKFEDQHIGTIAPFGFYSLNRGKNISTLAGGILTWKDAELAPLFEKHISELPSLSVKEQVVMLMKFFGLVLAVRPFIYTLLSAVISKFKYTTLHTHFDSFQYTKVQAALGINLWRRVVSMSFKRIKNGIELTKIFKDIQGVQIATPPKGCLNAFNQYPVIIDNLDLREKLMAKLLESGIETTTLYDEPLHHIFPECNPNDKDDVFPNATYLAEHLLLIPPHPQIRKKHLNIIDECVTEVFK